MTLTLSPEAEQTLADEAARRGTTPEEYARALLEDRLVETKTGADHTAAVATEQEPTLAALFAGRTGKINSGGRFNYSRDTGKAYAESLLKQKGQQKRLPEGQP